MSIVLDVEEYCHDCDGFEPRVRRMEFQNFDTQTSFPETFVSCEHSRKCMRMYEHIKKEVQRNG